MDENPKLQTIHALREKVKELWRLASKDIALENVDAIAAIYNDIQLDFDSLLELERKQYAKKVRSDP